MTTRRGLSLRGQIRKWYSLTEKGVDFKKFTFQKGEVLALLLCRDIDALNEYLDLLTLQTLSRYSVHHHITSDGLYSVHQHIISDELYIAVTDDYEEPYSCILGEEILDPCFTLGTDNQIRNSFEWHQKMNTLEAHHCKSLDSWLEFCLKLSLARIERYAKILSKRCTPWLGIFLEEGKGTQSLLIEYHQKILKELRAKESFMKRNKAPEFMLQEQGEKVAHMKLVIRKLADVISS